MMMSRDKAGSCLMFLWLAKTLFFDSAQEKVTSILEDVSVVVFDRSGKGH